MTQDKCKQQNAKEKTETIKYAFEANFVKCTHKKSEKKCKYQILFPEIR